MKKKSQVRTSRGGGGGGGEGSGNSAKKSNSSADKSISNPTSPTHETKLTQAFFDSISTEISSSLLQLEALSRSNNFISIQDLSKSIEQLEQSYIHVATKNNVFRKQEEALAIEVQGLLVKRDQSAAEYNQVQDLLYQVESKGDTLNALSKTLSDRLRITESKASEDVKYEKEERLKLSYEFSGKIKDISAKLDDLSQRREIVVSENLHLRQILKSCLEELEKEDDSGPSVSSMTIDVDGTVHNRPKAEDDESGVEEQERKRMTFQDDLSQIMKLQNEEDNLRHRSTEFMDVFDSFQERLTESNSHFRSKHKQVEELSKDVDKFDTHNRELSLHIKECTQSTVAVMENVSRIRLEKERFYKMIDKQRALMERFQNEIAEMESPIVDKSVDS
jgi:chromosome segregation ATPase